METAELLKKVRKIQIKTRRLSRHLFTGGYHSAFKGRGMSFSEVRQYQWGDDVRTLDWNVTARTGEPHIKIFEEEREQTLMLVVDVSGSAFFGTQQQFKQEILTEICAVLAFSAIDNQNKVGALLFSDRPELFIPPRKGLQHTLRILRELLNVAPNNRGTDLAGALQYTRNLLRQHSVCFVLSDFLAVGYESPLRVMARRHDCVGIHVWDARERALPNVGLLHMLDAESGKPTWRDTTDPDFRRNYTQYFTANLAEARRIFQQAGADFLSISTQDSYSTALLHFFERRARIITH